MIPSIAVLAAGRVVLAEPQTREQLQQELNDLRARVAQLEATQTQREAAASKAVVDQTVASVMQDAEKHSQLLAEDLSLNAGHDKGRFFIRSADGNFLLMPGFLFQVRNSTNVNHNAGGTDTNNGFEIRRMRIFFEGNAFTPDMIYKFMWETNDATGAVFLQDAWVRYKFADQWKVEVGQFKDGIHHEEAMPDQYLMAADRSFVNALIGGANIDRIQGAMLMFDDAKHWRVNAVAHDGYNTKNTDFTDTGGGSPFVGITNLDFGLSGRAEYTVMGPAKEYDDFTAMGNTQNLLVIGGGVDWSEGGSNDVVFHTVDVQYENTKGLGLYGAILGMWRDLGSPVAPVAAGNFYDFGGLVQASYMVNPTCEVFGRAEYIQIDTDAIPGVATHENLQELTIGTNYYWRGHNVKLTVDVNWLPNGSPITLPLLDVRAGDGQQVLLRFQGQLLL